MRRKFLDAALCQIKPAYARAAEPIQPNPGSKEYPAQGYFLSFGAFGNPGDVGRTSLPGLGAAVTIERKRYVERLSEAAGEIYDGISQERRGSPSAMTAACSGTAGRMPRYRERLFSLLQKGRKEDLNAGFTTEGAPPGRSAGDRSGKIRQGIRLSGAAALLRAGAEAGGGRPAGGSSAGSSR